MAKKILKPVFYTRNKKPVFDVKWHESYNEFTLEDHEDACSYHFNQWETLYEDLFAKTGTSNHANNKRLIKHESNWELHERFKSKIKLDQISIELKEKT